MRLRPWILIVFISALTGCDGKLLPAFDGGVLNPEFRFLRAGDVVNGVKCAMVAFMLEREQELIKQREDYPGAFEPIETKINAKNPQDSVYFSAYHLGAKRIQERSCTRGHHWIWPRDESFREHCRPGSQGCCVANQCKPGALGTPLWDYTVVKSIDPKARGCVPVPDYSRFALDPNQSATITFTLNGTNSGFVNYARIDATRLDGLYPNLIVQGGGPSSNPFPQMLPTMKGVTTFDLAVLMAQSLYVGPARSPDVPEHAPLIGIPIEVREKFAGLIAVTAIDKPDALLVDSIVNAAPAVRVNPTAKAENDLEEKVNALATGGRGKSSLATQLVAKWKDQSLPLVKAPSISAELKTSRYDTLVQPFVQDLRALLDLKKESAELMRLAESGNPKATIKALDEIRAIVARINDATTRERLKENLPRLTTEDLMAINYAKQRKVSPAATSETFTPQALQARGEQVNVTRAVSSPLSVKQSERAQKDPNKDIAAQCVSDRHGYQIGETAYVDYLALKRMLHNVVNEQNGKLHNGGPPVTMESLTLSTQFQVTLEIQAGTVHIFRIVPLLAAPNTEFKTDHTHTLKIAMKGVKRKGDPNYSTKLAASCKQRLQDNRAADQAEKCETLEGLFLEAITEALENSSTQ